jgi:uncharacterized membrane protein YfcA
MPLNHGMDPNVLLATLLIGAAVGFLSGMFGKGGAAISTPLLHAIGVPAMAAVASPLPATVPTTFTASRPYARAGRVDWPVVRLGLLFGVPAVILGALCTRWIPGSALVIATDVFVLVLALRMLRHGTREVSEAPSESHPRPAVVVAIAVAVGVLSGLLGNSGGILLTPLFVSWLRMPMHRALGTSLVLATGFAIPGATVHAFLGHIDWSITVAYGIAAIPCALLGARLALRVKERSLTVAWGGGLALFATGLLVFSH